MKNPMESKRRLPGGALMAACLAAALPVHAQSQTAAAPATQEPPASEHARGDFDVKLEPQADGAADPLLGRLSIDKQFRGELQASSRGQMLTATTAVPGSAGYVAIEKVSGRLAGRSGSFVLQHTGTMDRGAPRLSVGVVPDSGTGELTGITGTMKLDIDGGRHGYDLEYRLPPLP